MTMANAGMLRRIGTPPRGGAVVEQGMHARVRAQGNGPIAVREPAGKLMPNPLMNEVK
jgi:hypothetical protein